MHFLAISLVFLDPVRTESLIALTFQRKVDGVSVHIPTKFGGSRPTRARGQRIPPKKISLLADAYPPPEPTRGRLTSPFEPEVDLTCVHIWFKFGGYPNSRSREKRIPPFFGSATESKIHRLACVRRIPTGTWKKVRTWWHYSDLVFGRCHTIYMEGM